MNKKLLIFSAPSGSGKSTIINWLMQHEELHLAFSISCTSRAPRGTEQNGVEYFFLSAEEFRQRIANDEFLEYEEVYKDRFYGTLKQQVENQLAKGENVVFDLDVKGGCNIKQFYGDRALSIFIQPPCRATTLVSSTGRVHAHHRRRQLAGVRPLGPSVFHIYGGRGRVISTSLALRPGSLSRARAVMA